MDQLQDTQLDESIDRYNREHTRLMTKMKEAKYISDEKPIKSQLDCLGNVLRGLLRLRTLRRTEAEKGN
jgi:hypothetical protein